MNSPTRPIQGFPGCERQPGKLQKDQKKLQLGLSFYVGNS
jgi:hypothetical protein